MSFHQRAVLSAIVVLFASAALFADTPKGVVTKYTLNDSKIFPGTVHEYWVYVPAQYDGSKPACVYVNQDGIQFNAPAVFDQLIAAGEMPVTVGIFIRPGVVPPANPDALPRYNRSYEYDGLGDAYARFLLDELLPHVEAELHLNLSHEGRDRAIAGNSSGAICAFTVAWERPDAFQRVYTGVGTFVGLRGGDRYPTLIRESEPKPIRIYLTDGSNDLNIYGGDWWMANQTMVRALEFSGYEVNHAFGEEGHNAKFATEKFPDAMRWLWKDYPQPIATGLGSPPLQEVLLPDQKWELVADGYKNTEGPAVNARGELFFTDAANGKIWKVGLDGKVSLFVENAPKPDGQRFGPDGRLYTVAAETQQILAYDPDGKSTVIADGFRGNDLVVRHDGGIYVTEPGWDGRSPSKIWFISPAGEKKVVDTGLKFSNGITLSPDQTLLYVADSRTHWVYSYQAQPDGSLKYKQKYYHLFVPDTADDSGADGMRVDTDGRLYVATRMGIQICDQAGRVNCIVPTPNGRVSNLDLAGEKFNILYAASADKLYRRVIKPTGARNFEPPTKPKAPHL
ncbi:MAG: gluconolactonase [Planctomycetes bacterium]|nr:gluconolactonase [Planctomycetota bacterium]